MATTHDRLGDEFMIKAVCKGDDGLPVIRYLGLQGEKGRNDLVDAAVQAVNAYLKPYLVDTGKWPVPKDMMLTPGFLPNRLALVAQLVTGETRYLLIRCGTVISDLAQVAAEAAVKTLGAKLHIAELRQLAIDRKVDADGNGSAPPV